MTVIAFPEPLAANPDRSCRTALDADIATLDLEAITFLVAMEQDWSLKKLDAIELEYRCFLQLVRDQPDQRIVPSRDVDLYWHAHVLTLELYLAHCQTLFGAPLIHYPFSGRLGAEDAELQAQRFEVSQRMFAELLRAVRKSKKRHSR